MLKGNYFVGIALGMNLEKKSVLEIEVTQTINNKRVVVSIHKIQYFPLSSVSAPGYAAACIFKGEVF